MTTAEYVARVIQHYCTNTVRCGTLEFNRKQGCFIIKSLRGYPVSAHSGLHCGDVYIIKDTDGTWRIAQCELVGDVWKMVGSRITANSEPAYIIYVPHVRLTRFSNVWVNDEEWRLGALSHEFVTSLLNKK